MKTEESPNKELVATSVSITDFKSLEELEAWGDKIAKSGLTPLKEGIKVVAAVLMGKELGMSPMVSVNNIYPINGKGTLGVHLMTALLQKAGIVIELVRDYEPCIFFAKKGEDGKTVFYKGGVEVPRGTEGANPLITREGFLNESPRDYEVAGNTIVNYKSMYKFTRKLKQADGEYFTQEHFSSYSINEAKIAGLLDKDNWKNYPKQMCGHRAFAFGARFIAGDILMGMYETSEMLDVTNTKYTIMDDKITIIEKKESNPIKSTENIQEVSEVKEESLLTDKN